ncbi:hypothetical protein PPACK8108_LOCUS23303 [Phakopsora pachyrhizi]|uniref:Uncharacterized protein n=1 Tax=Phakopsora pachyrhizi TaxID=170000 RepID=A0AAV0BMS1_PHAPC|nr:hypothetical protein PPACK8108_LOCUS23303 [Phakopsora pachyrhizi]
MKKELKRFKSHVSLLGVIFWSEVYPDVSNWEEAKTDRLGYDLIRWEPVE